MTPGARICLVVDEHGYIVGTRAPYGLSEAMEHVELLEPKIRAGLRIVLLDVVSDVSAAAPPRDTIPAPPET